MATLFLAGWLAVTASGCLSPLERVVDGDTVQLQITAAHQQIPSSVVSLVVRVGFADRDGGLRVLSEVRRSADSASQQAELIVPLAACLSFEANRTACPLLIDASLRSPANATLDSVRVGPLEAVPGRRLVVPAIRFRTVDRVVPTDTALRVAVGRSQRWIVSLRDSADNGLLGRRPSFRSADPAIATISDAGDVIGVSPGRTTVFAERAGAQAAATVTVPVVEELALEFPEGFELVATAEWSIALRVAVAPGQSNTLRFRSDDTSIVVVDSVGRITGRAEGSTFVRVIADADSSAQVAQPVRVLPFRAVTQWNFGVTGAAGPLPLFVRGVWGAHPDTLFAIGGNQISRWDGSRWAVDAFVPSDQFAVAGASVEGLITVGSAIMRRSAGGWRRDPFTPRDTLRAAHHADGVTFAVGDRGLILRTSGTSWVEMPSGTTRSLRGVWAVDSTTAYAVGESGMVLRLANGSWSTVASGDPVQLNGVAVRDNGDVYATGIETVINSWGINEFGRVFQLDASGTLTAVSAISPLAPRIFGVWASGAEVLVVSDIGLIYRLAGSTWTLETSPPSAGVTLHAVTIVGDQAVAVGFPGVVHRRVGGSWTRENYELNHDAVWALSQQFMLAGGSSGAVDFFDGTAWRPVRRTNGHRIEAFWGSSPTAVWAVGWQGTVLRWDGANWQEWNLGTEQWFSGVWGTASDNVYAVGLAGLVFRFNGTSWTQVYAAGFGLRRIHGSAANNIWATGDEGRLLHFDGSVWSVVNTGSGAAFTDVYVPDSAHVFAVGVEGARVRRAGGVWRTDPPSGENLLWVDGTSARDVYTGGCGPSRSPQVSRFDGTTWTDTGPDACTLDGVVLPGGGGLLGGGARAIFFGTAPNGATPGRPAPSAQGRR